VTLIMKLAAALSERRWGDVDLILAQFDLPTSDYWESDQYSYAVHHIKDGTDEQLLELHDWLFPQDSAAQRDDASLEEEGNRIWEPGYFRLFISHSARQAVEVGALRDALRPYGISAFVAHSDINPTEQWRDVIEAALRTCEAMAAYVTPDFRTSAWTDQEVGVCLDRAVLIIPIRRGETPYGFMGKYQALQGANKGAERLAADVHGILEENTLTASRLQSAKIEVEASQAVEELEQAGSWNAARVAFHRLLRVPEQQLSSELLDRIERAAAINGELTAQWNFGATQVKDEAMRIVERVRAAGR
jgi:hypothetical protein